MKNSFKFFFFLLIRKIKVRLNLPKQKNLVIFDNTAFEDLENILKARDYFILKVRVNEIEEIFLNLQIIIEIFKNFLRYKTEKQKTTNIFWSSYLVSLITLLKPKLVITHIDNSKKFSEISKILSKKLKFFTIQNAARYDQIIEKKNSKEINKFYIQNFCCFSDYEIELYKSLNIQVDNFHKVGSIRNSNFLHYVQEKKINLNKNLYDLGVLLEVPLPIHEYTNNTEHFVLPLKYSIKYSVEKNLKLIFIGKFQNIKDHINYFEDYLDDNEIKIIKKNFISRDKRVFSSYMACFQCKILIGVASTLLREKISSGEKILCCNYSGSNIWNFPIKGLCFTKEKNYDFFKSRVDKILNATNSEYLSSLDRKCDYVLNNENDNSTILKLNKLIDKVLEIS